MRLLFLILSIAIFLLPLSASALTASAQVYISNRTDGLAGSGTISDPYNGSTEPKFDALMRGFPANTSIHILAGTYSTWGSYDCSGNSGFLVRSGWKIYGAGEGATILKQTGFPTGSPWISPMHFNSNGGICGSFELHDITLDCNSAALLSAGMLRTRAVGGVGVAGNNIIIDSVEVINSYGYHVGNTYGIEGFTITVGGRSDQHVTNVRISNCYTHSYNNIPGNGNYSNGPGIDDCDAGGIIENCVDDGGNHGFGGGGNTGIIFQNNTTTANTDTGFYLDTGGEVGIQIINNTFAATHFPIQFNTAANCSTVVVQGNKLTCANTANCAAIYITGTGSINGFSCLNNTYTGNANFLSPQGGATYTNFTVTGNTCIGTGGLLSNTALQPSSTNHIGTNTLHASASSSSSGATTSGAAASNLASAQVSSAPSSSSSASMTSVTASPLATTTAASTQTTPVTATTGNTTTASARFATLLPPSSGFVVQDRGIRAHTNLRVLDVPDTDGADVSQFNTPETLRAIYHLPSTGGSGAIAIVNAYHFPTALTDFNTFSQYFGLPRETAKSATSFNRTFQVVYANGVAPISAGSYISSWNLEAALDIEWAHAIAPNAKIYLVEAASNSNNDLFNAVRVASRLPGVKEVSMSWGGNEVPWENSSFDTIFAGFGVVYLASSGDSSDVMEYPAASPNVISCGGTSVNRNINGEFVTETGWNQTGCGTSTFEARPAYQSRVSSIVGGKRGVSDIAFDADPNTGVFVFDSTPLWGETGWWILGGTSVASPSLAGVINLAATAVSGFATSTVQEQSRLYANLGNGSAFRDIVWGTDGRYNCQPGWDFVTGLGTPNGLTGK